MLGAIIYPGFSARGALEPELALEHTSVNPVESHIHGNGALGDNGVIGHSHGGVIVGLDGRPPLGPFYFDDSLA